MQRSSSGRFRTGLGLHLSPRAPLAVAALAAIALVLGACDRMVTHESPSLYSVTSETAPDASFTYQTGATAPAPYRGTGKARASFDGGDSVPEPHAYGELDATNVAFDGTYGAAVYFEAGTLAGPQPQQQGTIDLMRWKDGTNWGGIRIGTDHKGHLVDSSGTDLESARAFAFQEGCWNWLVVRQRLKSTPEEGPVSEVFLNGEKVVSSTNVNTTSAIDAGVDRVQFGLAEMGTPRPNPVRAYLDDSYVSSSESPKPMVTSSAGKLCRPPPNVLLIVTDDQRADTVVGSAAENPIAQLAMPQTRKWFRDGAPGAPGGTEFPNGFVTTPWCCPARASIYSGQYAHNHNVRTLDPVELDGYAPKLQFSIQRYLRDWWGYRTALFGKFLNNWTFRFDPRVATPPETHFDEYEMINGAYRSGGINFPRPCAGPPMTSHSCIVKKDAGGDFTVFEQGQYTTHRFADSAKQFIEAQDAANDGQPWFMQVSPWAPHQEGETWGPNAWSKMTNGSNHAGKPIPALTPGPGHNEPDRWDKPEWVRGDGEADLGWSDSSNIFEKDIDGTTYPGLREQQLRALGDVDDMVEQIFDTLEAKGEADNTIAFFISDNGYMWREHSPNPVGIPHECYTDIAATPPQDQVACGLTSKARPYREAINVPFFVRWPNSPWTLPAVDSRLVANVDLAPTVLDAVGGLDLPLEQPMDGRSLFRSGQRARLLVEGWGAGLPDWASVVEPTKQYIFTDSDTDPDTDDPQWQELYDYPGDGQNLNLFGTDGTPNGGEPMRPPAHLLDAWRQCVGSACP